MGYWIYITHSWTCLGFVLIQFTTDLKCSVACFGLFLLQGLPSLNCQGLKNFFNLCMECTSSLHNERSLPALDSGYQFYGLLANCLCFLFSYVFVSFGKSFSALLSAPCLTFCKDPECLERIFSAAPAHFQTSVAKSLMGLKEFFFQISWFDPSLLYMEVHIT